MTIPSKLPSLRSTLLIDAATCAALGGGLSLGPTAIGGITSIPPALLFYAGLGLFPIAAFMAVVATRPVIPPAGVRLVVAGNLLWVALSLLLPASGLIAPNLLGIGFLAAQAVAVAVLAGLEHGALRGRAPRAHPA